MPPLPSVPNVIKLVTHFEDGALGAIVLCHLAYSGPPPMVSDIEAIAGAFGTSLMGHLAPKYNASMVLTTVDGFDLTSPISASGTAAVGTAGTDVNLPAAAQVAVLLHKTISRRYRGGHPRTYLPGFALDWQLDQRTWTAPAVLAAQTAWLDAVTAVAAGSPYGATTVTEEVNVSYFTSPPPGTRRAVPVVDTITSVTAEAIMATQRRRLQRSA